MTEHPIDPFLAAWSAVSGVDGFASRLRVYRSLRLPGAWNRARLRNVLRAILVLNAEQVPMFNETFELWFQDDSVDRLLAGIDVEAGLRQLVEATRGAPAPPRVLPEPPPVVTPPVKQPGRKRRRQLLALAAAAMGLAVVVALAIERPHPGDGPAVAPSSSAGARGTGVQKEKQQLSESERPELRYRLDIQTTPQPSPAYDAKWLWLAAGVLVLLGVVETWQALRRRKFRTPSVDALAIQSSQELRYPAGPRPQPFSAAELDRLAFRTGLALDWAAVRLNVRETVRRAADQAGLVTAMYDPRKQTRGVSVVLPQKLEETAQVVLEAFVDGLRRRGVPVQVTSGPPRWDTEDLILVAVDARAPSDPPVARWLTLPHVGLVEVRDPALWTAEVKALPRRVHPLSAAGFYQALEVAASGRSPLPLAPATLTEATDIGEVEQLGEAWPLAAACSIISPCDLGTADQLRRELLPSIPFLAFQRIRRLRGVTPDPTGWRFSGALSRQLQNDAGAVFTSRVLEWQAQRLAAISAPRGSRAEATLQRERALVSLKRRLLELDANGRAPSEAELLEPLRELERLGGDETLKRRVQERLMSLPSTWLQGAKLPSIIPWRIFRLSQNEAQRPAGRDPEKRPKLLSVLDALGVVVALVLVILALPKAPVEALISEGLTANDPLSLLWLWVPTQAGALEATIERTHYPAPGHAFVSETRTPGGLRRVQTLSGLHRDGASKQEFEAVAFFEDAPPAVAPKQHWASGEVLRLRPVVTRIDAGTPSWNCSKTFQPSAAAYKTIASLPLDPSFDALAAALIEQRVVGCIVREAQASLRERAKPHAVATQDGVLEPLQDTTQFLVHRVTTLASTEQVIAELVNLGFPRPAPRDAVVGAEPKPATEQGGVDTDGKATGVAPVHPKQADCKDSWECSSNGKCSGGEGACRATRDADCRASLGCASEGACSAKDGECVPLNESDCAAACANMGRCALVAGRCVPAGEKDCTQSRNCSQYGYCAFKDGDCHATEKDCRASTNCREFGRCTFWQDGCLAKSAADCAAASGCGQRGDCGLVGGLCGPTSDDHCRTSARCLADGHCSLVGQYCVATRDEDCRRAGSCKSRGACSAVEGNCRPATNEDCQKSDECSYSGRCSVSKNNDCIAQSDAACKKSTSCHEYGECFAFGDVCVPRGDSCGSTRGCSEWGLCSVVKDQCQARSDADCAKSLGCSRSGYCKARGGRCVADSSKLCSATSGCRYRGECTALDGECRATVDAECEASDACKTHGLCTASGGACVATSDQRCKSAPDCGREGACWARDSDCRPLSEADCKASSECGGNGRCALIKDHCGASTDEMCRVSGGCKQTGSCVAKNGICMATSDAMCRDSDGCSAYGACFLVLGACLATSEADCQKSKLCASIGWCHVKDGWCRATEAADCEGSQGCKEQGACTLQGDSCVAKSAK